MTQSNSHSGTSQTRFPRSLRFRSEPEFSRSHTGKGNGSAAGILRRGSFAGWSGKWVCLVVKSLSTGCYFVTTTMALGDRWLMFECFNCLQWIFNERSRMPYVSLGSLGGKWECQEESKFSGAEHFCVRKNAQQEAQAIILLVTFYIASWSNAN